MTISPEEFERRMKGYRDTLDTEMAHVKMDVLMCEVLKQLGYTDGIKIFDAAYKWYA